MPETPFARPKKTKTQAVLTLLRHIKAISKAGSEVSNIAQKAIWLLKEEG
jgi:hypothetical protein